MPVAAAIAVASVATVGSIQQGRQSAKEAKKASKTQQRLQDVQTARERRKQVRAARLANAETAIGGVASGTGGSSKQAGLFGGTSAQLAGNVSFLDQSQALTASISKSNQKAADFATNSNALGAVSSLAVSAAGSGLFSGQKTPKKTK